MGPFAAACLQQAGFPRPEAEGSLFNFEILACDPQQPLKIMILLGGQIARNYPMASSVLG